MKNYKNDQKLYKTSINTKLPSEPSFNIRSFSILILGALIIIPVFILALSGDVYSQEKIKIDHEVFLRAKAVLLADINKDNLINDDDDVPEKADPGKCLMVNMDYDLDPVHKHKADAEWDLEGEAEQRFDRENDFCEVHMGFGLAGSEIYDNLSKGIVKLERGNQNIRVWWKDESTLQYRPLLYTDSFETWDFSMADTQATNQHSKIMFDRIKDNLFVEGVSRGSCKLILTYYKDYESFLADKEDNRDTITFNVYGPVSIYLEDDKGCVYAGETATAKGLPDSTSVEWSIESKDPGVKASIDPSTGLITVEEETESGYISVKATDTSVPCCCYNQREIHVGCRTCTPDNSQNCQYIEGSGSFKLSSVDVHISLGKAKGGITAGDLYIQADKPSKDLATPRSLAFSSLVRDGVETLSSGSGKVRQVLAPRSLADVEVISDSSYEVNFYRPGDIIGKKRGFYDVDPSAEPFVTWRIENPDASDTAYNRLRIMETKDGVSKVSEYVWDEGQNGWSLSRGNGLVIESRTEELDVNAGNRIITDTIKDKSGTIASKVQTTHHRFPWGEEVTKEVVDPDGAALTTTTNYHEDPAQVGNYGKMQSRVNSDGSWVQYQYDKQGRKIMEVRSWLDYPMSAPSTGARVISYDYNPVDINDVQSPQDNHRPRTVTEEIQGIKVSKTFYAYLTNTDGERIEIVERCASPLVTAWYNRLGNQCTVSTYYTSGTGRIEAGRIKSTLYPDGRLDTYTYESGKFIFKDNPAEGSFLPSIGSNSSGMYMRVTTVHGTVSHPEGVAYKTIWEDSIQDQFGHELLRETYVSTGSIVDKRRIQWTAQYYDEFGRLVKVINSDGTMTESIWTCCAKESDTDARGIRTSYSYDDLQRVTTVVKEGVESEVWPSQGDIYTSYTYDAAGRQLTETVSGGGLSLTASSTYDTAGRLLNETDSQGLVTSYTYEQGGMITTVIRPGGSTEVTTRYLDGQRKSITGNGVIPQYYEYGVNAVDGAQWTKGYTGSMNSHRWEKSTTDVLGRAIKVEKPGFEGVEISENYYDDKGRLVKTTATGQADVLYEYDELGDQIRDGLDVNHNDRLDLGSNDRINESDTYYTLIDGNWWQESIQRVYAVENNAAATTTGVKRSRITGLGAGGMIEESVSIDIRGNQIIGQVFIDRSNKTETGTTDYPNSTINEVLVSVNGLLMSSQGKDGVKVAYGYDGLGRRIGIIDPRTGTAITHFNSKGQVDYIEDAAGNRTIYVYDPATGRNIAKTDALGKVTRYAYDKQGRITHVWGDASYPVRYEYDAYGQKSQMHTYRGGNDWNTVIWPTSATGTADITKWHYHEATGLLTSKEDAESKQVAYTYGSGGKLATRIWARTDGGMALVTNYVYDNNTGELIGIDYSDSTPDISFVYNRLGRQKTITDAAGTRTFTYNSTLQFESEAIAGLYNKVITRTYESAGLKGRSTGFTLGAEYRLSYGYDTVGRFSTVGWNVAGSPGSQGTATYSYVSNSGLISQYKLETSGITTNLVTSYVYEAKRDLRTQVKNTYDTQLISRYDYGYDTLGRRKSVANSGQAFAGVGNAFNLYGYNTRNELTESSRYLGADIADTSNPVQPEYRQYSYDHIGNRQQNTDWDKVRGSLRTASYTANSLNQYTQQVITGDGTNNFTYDDDGNLTSISKEGAMMEYTYNAENRLIAVAPETPVDGDKKVEYIYDYMGRRVRKQVYEYSSGSWTNVTDTRFVYDGWNVVQEIIDGARAKIKAYVWGLDLSGTLQGAGGVGGLLASVDPSPSTTYYYLYDVNGNVGQLVDGGRGEIVAHYEYDPYGNGIVVMGSVAEENQFRFSTKYFDEETELYYYGYRYYSPRLGRWLRKDPLGILGGHNLYLFLRNCVNNRFDYLGFADLLDGSFMVLENATGMWGEWLESDSEKAGESLEMGEGFENKWAEKHEIRESFQTATKDDIVIFLGHSYTRKSNGERGIMPATDLPFPELGTGTTYSVDEMIKDINKDFGAPAIILFISCSSVDIADEISKRTSTKIVIGTDRNVSNTGEARELLKAFYGELNLYCPIETIVKNTNTKCAGGTQLVIKGNDAFKKQTVKELIKND